MKFRNTPTQMPKIQIPINNKNNRETKSDLNVMAYGGG